MFVIVWIWQQHEVYVSKIVPISQATSFWTAIAHHPILCQFEETVPDDRDNDQQSEMAM